MLDAAWLGRRVTLRRELPVSAGPRFGDVVGVLLHLDDDHAVLDTRAGLVEVDPATVTIAKPAPPSTGDELALEAVAAAGWRARESEQLGGWVLRADGGFTGRANSVLPLAAPGRPLTDALDQARHWYAERGLALRLAVPTEARRLLDAELGERGWPFEPEVHVMAGYLRMLRPFATRPDVEVTIDERPDDAWLARYRDGAGASEVGRALLTRHDRAGFASVRDGTRVVAIARGAVDDGWLGVSAVEVDPELRRQGLGAAVTAALWRWGRERGAARSYLQVSSDNLGAVRLYERLGYWTHHDYRYRLDPGNTATA